MNTVNQATNNAVIAKNVIDATDLFTNRKCPVGSMAIHNTFGAVEIIAKDDDYRTVGYAVHTPLNDVELYADLPTGVLASEILAGERIEHMSADVHVTSLTELNVKRDLGDGVPVSEDLEDVPMVDFQ